MAPKRARKAVSTSSSYDESRFPDQETYERYLTSLPKRILVPERVFDNIVGNFPEIDSIISRRNWHTLCMVDPGPAVIRIVREFYAAAESQQEGRVKVRGKIVVFDKEAINKHYKIHTLPVDEFNAYLSEPDLDEVIKYLCPFGATWVDRKQKAHAPHFPKKAMSSTARAWFYFICARLIPSRHRTEVTKDRAILIYCILTGKAIDVGSLIYSKIMYDVTTKRVSLLFPSLITNLCKKAGIRWDPSEEILQPDNPMTTRMIKDPDSQGVSEPLPSQPSPSLTMEDRLSAIEIGLREHRQEFQQFRSECNQSLHQILQQCAIFMGVPTNQPVPCPTQPVPPHFPVHTPEADEHDDE